MEGNRGSGAALRRRKRRLRAWERHVRKAVQLALAETLHHSAINVEQHYALWGQEKRAGRQVEEHGSYASLRAQMAPPPGERLGCLFDPGPQRSDRSLRRFAGDGTPDLALPSLPRSAWEAVDGPALAFLTSRALATQVGEEEADEGLAVGRLGQRRSPAQEARLLEVTRRRAALIRFAVARRRKKKKKRKGTKRTRRRRTARRSACPPCA